MVSKEENGRGIVPKGENGWRLVPKETKISLNSKFTLFGYNILD